MKSRIFISSVQREFAKERKDIASYIRKDAILGKFFEVFLFEEVPAQERKADGVYLSEVDACDIYLGIFGHTYDNVDSAGVSATEREYQRAAKRHKSASVSSTSPLVTPIRDRPRSFPGSTRMWFAEASSVTTTCAPPFTLLSLSAWRTKVS